MNSFDETIKSLTDQAQQLGAMKEQQRIRARIMDRVTDLKNCSDDDDCHLFGEFIESYIPEWLGEEE